MKGNPKQAPGQKIPENDVRCVTVDPALNPARPALRERVDAEEGNERGRQAPIPIGIARPDPLALFPQAPAALPAIKTFRQFSALGVPPQAPVAQNNLLLRQDPVGDAVPQALMAPNNVLQNPNNGRILHCPSPLIPVPIVRQLNPLYVATNDFMTMKMLNQEQLRLQAERERIQNETLRQNSLMLNYRCNQRVRNEQQYLFYNIFPTIITYPTPPQTAPVEMNPQQVEVKPQLKRELSKCCESCQNHGITVVHGDGEECPMHHCLCPACLPPYLKKIPRFDPPSKDDDEENGLCV